MKKAIAMLMALCIMLCVTACGSTAPADTTPDNPPETSTVPATEPTFDMEDAVDIGNLDCSGGWMSERIPDITVTGDFELIYTFDYQGYLGIMNPWENVNSSVHDGQGNFLTIVCNGDGWQVGDVWLKPSNKFTVPGNVDPMEILSNAKAVVIYKRVGSKFTIDGTFTNGDLVGKWYAETDDPALPETLYFRLGGEYCKLTNIKALGVPEQPINNIT